MPYAFFRAVEETVTASLRDWRVTDCAVTMTHSGYWARQSSAHGVFDKSMSSTARDFRLLTPVVLRTALEQAGTIVLSRWPRSAWSARPTRWPRCCRCSAGSAVPRQAGRGRARR